MQKNNHSFWLSLGLIILASLSRIIPHPPNFTPLTGVALFGGQKLNSKWLAFFIPLTSLFITDLILGFHATMPYVYGAFILTILLGLNLKSNFSPFKLLGFTLTSSTLFFLITNFGVWMSGGLYPKSIDGLFLCYAAALPFFQWSILGDLLYTAVIFSAYSFVIKKIPSAVKI